MNVQRLAIGERPDDATDCVKIEETADGDFELTGTVLCRMAEEEPESVSLVATRRYSDVDEAEQVGVAWAEAQGVEQLVIGYGTLAQPMRLSEADRPI